MGRLELQEAIKLYDSFEHNGNIHVKKLPAFENQVEKVKTWYDSDGTGGEIRRFPPGTLEGDHLTFNGINQSMDAGYMPDSVTKTEYLTKKQIMKQYPMTEKEAFVIDQMYPFGITKDEVLGAIEKIRDEETWAQKQANKMWYGGVDPWELTNARHPKALQSYRMLMLDMGEIKKPVGKVIVFGTGGEIDAKHTYEWHKPTYFPDSNTTYSTLTTSDGYTGPSEGYWPWWDKYQRDTGLTWIDASTDCGLTWNQFIDIEQTSCLHRELTDNELLLLL